MRNELHRSAIIFAVLFYLCLAVAAPAMADEYYVQVSSQRSEASLAASSLEITAQSNGFLAPGEGSDHRSENRRRSA